MDFAKWVLMTGEDKQIRVMGPAILSGIFKILRTLQYVSDSASMSLKGSAYSTISLICKRLPAVFTEHFDCKYL